MTFLEANDARFKGQRVIYEGNRTPLEGFGGYIVGALQASDETYADEDTIAEVRNEYGENHSFLIGNLRIDEEEL